MPNPKVSSHWIAPIATSSLPSHVVSLSLSASAPPEYPGQSQYDFSLKRWTAYHRTRNAGRDDSVEKLTGSLPSEWWLALQKIALPKRRIWILSPDAAMAFRILEGWEYSDSGLISWGNLTRPATVKKRKGKKSQFIDDCSLVLSPSCAIITHRIGQARVTWVSTTNYLDTDFRGWAETVGIDYPDFPNVGPGGTSFQWNPTLTARVIDRYFARLMGRYLSDGGGHWRATAAQLSHQTWRKSHYTHPVLAHADRTAHSLERSALFGGRAEVNFFGTVGEPPGAVPPESTGPEPASPAVLDGPVFSYDVRSQYPAILRDRIFPVAFDRLRLKAPIPFLETHCRHASVIADVEIETPSPDYPVRIGGEKRVIHGGHEHRYGRKEWETEKQVCYPVGRFWTTLCGPELLHAIERDRVIRCRVAAVYSAAPAFKSFAGSMIAERDKARSGDDPSRESLCKLLANSFVGKFAAKGGGWKTVPGKCPPNPWDQWPEIDAETETVISWRSLSGIAQRWEPKPDEPVGVPSIFAYCTSYGRVQMLTMMHAVGPRGWIHCHTDGVALTESGRTKLLQSAIRTCGTAGNWREEGEIQRCRAWGPSHYFCDGTWTLSGWADGAWVDTRGTVFDWRRDEVSKLIAAKGKAEANFTLRRSILSASIPSGAVGPDGWAIPPTLINGERQPRWVADD